VWADERIMCAWDRAMGHTTCGNSLEQDHPFRNRTCPTFVAFGTSRQAMGERGNAQFGGFPGSRGTSATDEADVGSRLLGSLHELSTNRTYDWHGDCSLTMSDKGRTSSETPETPIGV
jgi:hypothetical protein